MLSLLLTEISSSNVGTLLGSTKIEMIAIIKCTIANTISPQDRISVVVKGILGELWSSIRTGNMVMQKNKKSPEMKTEIAVTRQNHCENDLALFCFNNLLVSFLIMVGNIGSCSLAF